MPPSDSFTILKGLTNVPSRFAPKETMARMETEIGKRGMNVFARIDHAAGAAEVGLTLRPTELIIFGSARGGTPLMQSAQTAGIDLPLKVLVWEDAGGQNMAFLQRTKLDSTATQCSQRRTSREYIGRCARHNSKNSIGR